MPTFFIDAGSRASFLWQGLPADSKMPREILPDGADRPMPALRFAPIDDLPSASLISCRGASRISAWFSPPADSMTARRKAGFYHGMLQEKPPSKRFVIIAGASWPEGQMKYAAIDKNLTDKHPRENRRPDL